MQHLVSTIYLSCTMRMHTIVKIFTRVLFRSALSSAISSSRSSSVSLACVSSFVSVENSCGMEKKEEITDE